MRVVMMGTGTFAQPTFEALLTRPGLVVALVTQPDRASGAQRSSTRLAGPGMKELATAAKVPVFQPENINSPDGLELLRNLKADLLAVAAYGQILSRDVLAAATLGGINVHASLLPKYRGAAPIAWAIYHGETRTGVTIIRMSAGLDAGDILAQEAVDILPDETAGELETRLAPIGARLALEIVERVQLGPVAGTPQDQSQATKAPKLKKEDGLIDWTRSAEQICRHVRAMQPWPTAYTFLHRAAKLPVRIMIQKAKAVARKGPSASPGALTAYPKSMDRLFVETSDSREAVEVLQLQPSGKKSMTAAEFLRGHLVQPGDRFGAESI